MGWEEAKSHHPHMAMNRKLLIIVYMHSAFPFVFRLQACISIRVLKPLEKHFVNLTHR